MIYALAWSGIGALLALWSLFAWVLHAVAVWAISNAGALTGVTSGVGAIPVPAWIAPWMSPEALVVWRDAVAGLAPLVDGLLNALPSLSGGVTVGAWVLWALGSVALLCVGAGLHLLIALWRRGTTRPGPAPGRTAAA